MKKLAIFVSGTGTNMEKILCKLKETNYSFSNLVIISNKKCKAIETAQKFNIKSYIFNLIDFEDINSRDQAILDILQKNKIDVIVLAGYLAILTSTIIDKYDRKIINIHPSLIPNYCGDGYYGMKVHNSVFENNDEISGITIHYVDKGTDTGEIIVQKEVNIKECKTPSEIADLVRVLEHKYLPVYTIKLMKGEI